MVQRPGPAGGGRRLRRVRRLPPLAALEAFDAAARLGSFLAAAELLHLTPSAISHRIRALEADLGAALFVRTHRRVTLTEAGAAFHADVARALDAIAQATLKLAGDARRCLRLSVAPAFGRAWLLDRLAEYEAQVPTLAVELSASTRLEPITLGEVDLGIRFTEAPPAGLTSWKLLDEAIFPVCHPDYPARSGGWTQPADLTHARLLRHPLLSWARWFAQAGVTHPEPDDGPWFEDGALMLDACAAGHGVALATTTLAQPWLASGRLIRPFPIALQAGSFYLLAAPGARDKAWVEAFARWLTVRAREGL